MFEGVLEEIFIGPTKGQPMQAVKAVRAIAGAGLEGDRYGVAQGSFSSGATPAAKKRIPAEQQVTLIEAEAIDALPQEGGARIEARESRRNLLVRGVPLNHLVGKEFSVGEVRLRGIELCEPCGHLQKMTVPGIKTALLHRGGLRAEILAGGELRVGDVVAG